MFDIGFSELLVVFVVGLLILGPERLPHAAKTAGLWVRKIRRSINSVQREINAQLDQEELQQKITETNQRILKEGQSIQNKITPYPESAAMTDNEPEPLMVASTNQKITPENDMASRQYNASPQDNASRKDDAPEARQLNPRADI